jgi:hypothetical protein
MSIFSFYFIVVFVKSKINYMNEKKRMRRAAHLSSKIKEDK